MHAYTVRSKGRPIQRWEKDITDTLGTTAATSRVAKDMRQFRRYIWVATVLTRICYEKKKYTVTKIALFVLDKCLPEAAVFERTQNKVVRIVMYLSIVAVVVCQGLAAELDRQTARQSDTRTRSRVIW